MASRPAVSGRRSDPPRRRSPVRRALHRGAPAPPAAAARRPGRAVPAALASMQQDALDVARTWAQVAASRYACAAGLNRVKNSAASSSSSSGRASTAAPLLVCLRRSPRRARRLLPERKAPGQADRLRVPQSAGSAGRQDGSTSRGRGRNCDGGRAVDRPSTRRTSTKRQLPDSTQVSA